MGVGWTDSMEYLIASLQGDLIAPQVWEIVGRKNLAIFKGCHYSRWLLNDDFLKFLKNQDKEFKLRSIYLTFPYTEKFIRGGHGQKQSFAVFHRFL